MVTNIFAAALLSLSGAAWAQRIDYSDPAKYLKAGTQSEIDAETLKTISAEVAIPPESMGTVAGIGKVFYWIQDNFKYTTEFKDSLIGKSTAKSLLDSRLMSGCHDWGLMLAALLRKFDYPAIMVDASGVQWARDFSSGKTQGYSGHIFIEAYVGGKWILIDSTSGRYFPSYDYRNQLIPMKVYNQPELWVLHKGLDPADYGIQDKKDLHRSMARFAGEVDGMNFQDPGYTIKQLPR